MLEKKMFKQLGLSKNVTDALSYLGYKHPTPIQQQGIPLFLKGHDLLAQAQTGTGKTAAFALPILSQLKISEKFPQALIIVPTRELAIQVSKAIKNYAKFIQELHVCPIYGGQNYNIQIQLLRQGSHIIVGTPGRIIDHLNKKTLRLNQIKTFVLDEADEMLKMGFIHDIQKIIRQLPTKRQSALFSATLPHSIRKIAEQYFKNAVSVHVDAGNTTVETIEQSYTKVARHQKFYILDRFLEVENIQAAIIFTRTKIESLSLTEKLQSLGYKASVLNGDLKQSARVKVIENVKKGYVKIIVATDIAARGIDIERLTHVVNFDMPYDSESYIHRIGRTGRAGRTGKALSLISPREMHLLRDVESLLGKKIKHIPFPSIKEVKKNRATLLKESVKEVIKVSKDLPFYQKTIESFIEDTNSSLKEVATSLVYLIMEKNYSIFSEIKK